MASIGVMWHVSVSCHICIGRVTQECCGVSGIDVWLELLMCDLDYWCVIWIIDVWLEFLMCDLNESCLTWIFDVWLEWLMCHIAHQYDTVWHINHSSHTWHITLPINMIHQYDTLCIRIRHDAFTRDIQLAGCRVFTARRATPRNTMQLNRAQATPRLL